MIHPEDYDAMEKLFRGTEIPDDLVAEYELQRKMAGAYGHVGAMGMHLVIPMMRHLGYGKVVEHVTENVDWRKHMGEEVIADYGDTKVPGVVTQIGTRGRLGVELRGHGYTELPKYCVQLAPTKELEMSKSAWDKVQTGAKVTVQLPGAKPMTGKFIQRTPDGVHVRVGNKESVYPPERVELTT